VPELLLITLYITGGLVLLYFGADWLVKGAITLALHLGLSPLIVGLTVVALGTSIPEALVSVQAAIGHAQQMMVNVESELRKIGCPKINLQIRSGNAKVMAFYQKLGFTDDRVLSMGKRLEEDHS